MAHGVRGFHWSSRRTPCPVSVIYFVDILAFLSSEAIPGRQPSPKLCFEGCMSSDSSDQPSAPPAGPSDSGASRDDGKPIRRPDGYGGYRFAVVSALRAGQLIRGCTPRIDGRYPPGHRDRTT